MSCFLDKVNLDLTKQNSANTKLVKRESFTYKKNVYQKKPLPKNIYKCIATANASSLF